ncbi:uncharacterized protein LOC131168081 isoform X2 [Malania oleifera]|uniref:uncharacterized protein LOC131168081 isoform X2 n=1 Tax=Malania oleifera TaxID=397392 RepID=UPI0025ADF68D|nr:uncharacterized protein LOC131168081 isoform X2 [Malania oleifera]
MGLLPNQLQGSLFLNHWGFNCCSPSHALMLLQQNSRSYGRQCGRIQSSLQGGREVMDTFVKSSLHSQAYDFNGRESGVFPHVQTLRRFPKEELYARIVMVRFDSAVLLRDKLDPKTKSVTSALSTIKYLCEAGAKVILLGGWSKRISSELFVAESVADFLSLVLQLKVVAARCNSSSMMSNMKELEEADVLLLENLSEFKEEPANCLEFAERLSSGVDIFVNDCFSQSHRILASTVGVARFCYACLAGFHFEEGLYQLKKVAESNKKPYVAIIGGGRLLDKAAALHFLVSKCDGLVFVGMMAFQIMHALGLPVPFDLVEQGASKEASNIIQFARHRNIPVLYPKDFWCMNHRLTELLEVFPAHCILEGWAPVDLGPNSMDEIESLLLKCKKIIWIGPVKFRLSSQDITGPSKLAYILDKLSQSGCDITVVGNIACKAFLKESESISDYDMVENASVVWEFLKGRKLPGLMALDKAFPFEIDWNVAYCDPAQPLVVDIGSGNGLFILGMATRRKDLNFLGLEINEKLVRHCLDSVHQSGINNVYFIGTNATSTFRSIVSSYPGELVLVSIQCPNPDFNEPEHRWRMVQRSLVEAVADLLALDGKVFLQSDIEAVAVRMKEQFLNYGKSKLSLLANQENARADQEGWLKENPFEVLSDWEQHVVDRGAPMYRLMLSKSLSAK